MNKAILNLIIGLVILVFIWFVIDLIGMKYAVVNFVEWTTKFILPWIVLYWFIELVKSIRVNK